MYPLATPDMFNFNGGEWTGGGWKIVHHTTEGSSYAGARATYLKTRAIPHFTDSFDGGVYRVWQHLELNVAARALSRPWYGRATNTDNVIQIEHVGWAESSPLWAQGYLEGIGWLCRWIEGQVGVRRKAGYSFAAPPKLNWGTWHDYSGHLGHCHVPYNNHTDPGNFAIEIILETGVYSKVDNVVSEVKVQEGPVAFYQLMSDGGVRVVGIDRKPLDGVPFFDYYVVGSDGNAYYFGKERNGGVFSYPGLPPQQGVRTFHSIFLG